MYHESGCGHRGSGSEWLLWDVEAIEQEDMTVVVECCPLLLMTRRLLKFLLGTRWISTEPKYVIAHFRGMMSVCLCVEVGVSVCLCVGVCLHVCMWRWMCLCVCV